MDSHVSEMVDKAKQAIIRVAGEELRLLVLYGSEARGEATPESDIDLLAVLETGDPATIRGLRDAMYDIMWEFDFARLISLHIMRLGDYLSQSREGYSFIRNVEKEGQVLWSAA